MTATAIVANSFVLNRIGFKGVDQRAGCSTGIDSFPDMLNFKVNEDGFLVKRNGYELFGTSDESTGACILCSSNTVLPTKLLAAYGNRILTMGSSSNKLYTIGETKSDVTQIFSFQDKTYILAGDFYERCDNGIDPASPYIPLVAVACSANGAGTVLEKPNILTPTRRVKYSCTGTDVDYILPEKNLASIDSIVINGGPCHISYSAHPIDGAVYFNEPPPEGVNNMEIYYTAKRDTEREDMIKQCRKVTIFENRLFMYDNPDYPNYIFHTELADGIPSAVYFTESCYHVFDEKVMALTPCYNRLMIFFKDFSMFTFSELKTDILGNTYTSFPVYQLNGTKGHILSGNSVSFDNTPITLCEDGLNKWVSTVISDERSATVFSAPVFKKLKDMLKGLDDVRLFNRRSASELWIYDLRGVTVYNYRLGCFYFYDIENISTMAEHFGDLILALSDGKLYKFADHCTDDNGAPIYAYFETPFCTFGSPYSLKSLNGIAVTVSSTGDFEADIQLTRGNGKEVQALTHRLVLDSTKEDCCRRARERLHLKRFYSCKLRLGTYSDDIIINSIHLFGKKYSGNTRTD